MARLQLLLVVSAWLFVGISVVRAHIRRRPHRHWMTAFETLRGWDAAGEHEPLPR